MRNDFRPPVGIPFINKHKTPVGIVATNNNIGMKYYFRHRRWNGRSCFPRCVWLYCCYKVLFNDSLQGGVEHSLGQHEFSLSSHFGLALPFWVLQWWRTRWPIASKVRMYVVLGLPSLNPLSPNIHIQILQTDLYTFPWRMSWENLIKDQSIFS